MWKELQILWKDICALVTGSQSAKNKELDVCVCVCVCVCAQSCPTLCGPMDYSPPDSSVHGTFQARILEVVAISYSKGSSPAPGIEPKHLTSPALAGGFFTTSTSWEAYCISENVRGPVVCSMLIYPLQGEAQVIVHTSSPFRKRPSSW